MTVYARRALLIVNLDSSLAALPACNRCFAVPGVFKYKFDNVDKIL